MRKLRSVLFLLLALVIVCSAGVAQRHAPAIRIIDKIDESRLVTLHGNTHPAANAKNDLGRVDDNLPMTDLILVLSRDPAQQAAFDKFVASQYDPNSANFHQWLTPEQVGENFGPSETDIATVSQWLTGRGFTVTQVTKDRMSIRFNGSASLVQSAFHTEIHNLQVKGVQHIANMTDPQIPEALGTVVVGVKSLHNFFPKPLHRLGKQVQRDSATGLWKRLTPAAATSDTSSSPARTSPRTETAARPEFGISVGGTTPYLVEDVGPWDFATIYNIKPLWNAGIDGTGQTIAIAGTSAINLGQSATAVAGSNGNNDIATFRTYFNLPTNNLPTQISGNSQPLQVCTSTASNAICGVGDLEENTLDVEWSGAVAKNAQIVLVASYPASNSDDNLYDSESYIVDNLTARIMNVSYGECELGNGTAENVKYYQLWQAAAAEGIAVFVATGDSGAASCDQGQDNAIGLPYPAEYGTTVSGLASTPFNTAVGGTDFNWCPLTSTDVCATEAARYWSTSNDSTTQASALGYVPEQPWNDTCTSPMALGILESNFSGVTDAETGCDAIVVNAQRLSTAYLNLVDTVGGSGGASGCIVSTSAGSCVSGSTDTGTANGSIPLTNNGWQKPSWQTGVAGIPSDGVRDIPDVSFFASDGYLSGSAYLVCVSQVSACNYSTKTEPTAQEVGGTSVATPAMAGVMALINQKAGSSQGNPNAELYKLASVQTYSSCSAESVTASSSACYFNDIDQGTNAMACDYSAYTNTPSPNCTRKHSSDYVGILNGYSATTGYDLATGLGSLNVANVVNAWKATIGSTAATVTVVPGQTSLNVGDWLEVTISVAGGTSGASTPTGTVALVATPSSGASYFPATGTLTASGNYIFNIPTQSLGTGNITLTGSYSGDSTYGAAMGSAQIATSAGSLLPSTITVSPATTTVNSNASLAVKVSISGTGGAQPTGTVSLSGGGYASSTQWAQLVNGSYTFSVAANTLNANSSGEVDTLTATYSGDANYAAGTQTANVTVTESTFALGATAPATIAPGGIASSTVTVSSVAGYSGTVTLTCQLTNGPSGATDAPICTGGSSSPISMGGQVTFTITTTAPTKAALAHPTVHDKGRGWLGAGGGAVLALLTFFGIPARRRSWRQMLGAVVLMATLGSIVGCGSNGTTTTSGSGSQADPGTAAGTYTFTVQATGTPSVTPAVSTIFTVTVN